MTVKPLLDRVHRNIGSLLHALAQYHGVSPGGHVLHALAYQGLGQQGSGGSAVAGGEVDGKEIKMYLKEGDRVISAKYTGTEVKIDGEEYTIVKQSDILAVVEG